MKFAIVLLVACLAAVYAQPVPSAAAVSAPMAALGGAPQQTGGGLDFFSLGALTGTMGDSMRDLVMCQRLNLPIFLCLSGGLM